MFIIIDIQYVLLFHAGSCDGYTNITDTWRNFLFKSSSFTGYSKDDAALSQKWWRFTGFGGDRVVTHCVSGPAAGAHYIARVGFSYPTTESETATIGTAHGDVGACGRYGIQMSLVLCPGGFYIYKPTSHPHPRLVYATCKEWLLIVVLCFMFWCRRMSHLTMCC